jgi:hypothetical protein
MQVIGPYDPDAIRRLKDEVGDLYVSGSGAEPLGVIAEILPARHAPRPAQGDRDARLRVMHAGTGSEGIPL